MHFIPLISHPTTKGGVAFECNIVVTRKVILLEVNSVLHAATLLSPLTAFPLSQYAQCDLCLKKSSKKKMCAFFIPENQ